ncbi:hypothetical protein B0H16DRAFT_1473449 [Mycena metata]|uniref:Novel STAND NTPase 1 domain-containing protein n=1 Tax=Mycena metata TaxID=1033252 RepID=A0AAD7HL05_9AGAR|nr:hypothetical protein B0H16DRAFT_1473449 [Mycena metata]
MAEIVSWVAAGKPRRSLLPRRVLRGCEQEHEGRNEHAGGKGAELEYISFEFKGEPGRNDRNIAHANNQDHPGSNYWCTGMVVKKTNSHVTDRGPQNVKRNKDQCLQLVESIYPVLFAIVRIHLESKTVGSLPPAILEDVAEFTDCIEMQQDGNKIKQFFRQSEAHTLLKECQNKLDQAFNVLTVGAISVMYWDIIEPATQGRTTLAVLSNAIQAQTEAEAMHKELMELISILSEGTMSDQSSSVGSNAHLYKEGINFVNRCFTRKLVVLNTAQTHSPCCLQNQKYSMGVNQRLQEIMEALGQNAPRVAILGAGGMGKTSLARAALHHADTCARFEHRFWASAEAATTAVGLAALTGLHLSLEPGGNLTRAVVQYFLSQTSPCLLVLDNLETPWEPAKSREGVENLLSLLSEVEHLALVVTLRGSERPGKVRWSRPFLQPLQPLSNDAAHDERTQLLKFTENMPLAVDLMAHLVEYEGLSTVLTCWDTEKTSLLSIGRDKHSNLDKSIAISLSSLRITPGARELLSLLSILPDGLSDDQLIQGNLPISDILSCKSVLLTTSLAYKDTKNRLRSLVPIREHIRRFLPPSQHLVQSIRTGFHSLLKLYERHVNTPTRTITAQIIANLANLQSVLGEGLRPGSLDPFDKEKMAVQYNLVDVEELVSQGMPHLQHLDDPVLEGDSHGQCQALRPMAVSMNRRGSSAAALALSREAQLIAYRATNFFQAASAGEITAEILISLGSYTGALIELRKARELLDVCGHTGGMRYHHIVHDQAEIHIRKSEYQDAKDLHITLLQNTPMDKTSETHAYALVNIALIDVMIGTPRGHVHQNLDAARQIFTKRKSPLEPVYCDMVLADLNLREGNSESARTQFKQCLRSQDRQVVTYCLERLADCTRWPAKFQEHARWPMVCLSESHRLQEKLMLYKALLFIGDLEGFTFLDVHQSRAQCFMRLGELAQRRGESVKAAEMWRDARSLFERSLQAKDVEQIDSKLAALAKAQQSALANLTTLHLPTGQPNEELFDELLRSRRLETQMK